MQTKAIQHPLKIRVSTIFKNSPKLHICSNAKIFNFAYLLITRIDRLRLMVKSGKPIEWRYEFHPRYPYPSPKLVMAESIMQSGRSNSIIKKVALIAIIE